MPYCLLCEPCFDAKCYTNQNMVFVPYEPCVIYLIYKLEYNCISIMNQFYVHEHGLQLLAGVVLTPRVSLYGDCFFFLWHASLRHPAGTTSLPGREPCIAMHICFCTSAFVSLPAGGLIWCSRVRGTQGARVSLR